MIKKEIQGKTWETNPLAKINKYSIIEERRNRVQRSHRDEYGEGNNVLEKLSGTKPVNVKYFEITFP